MTDSEWLDGPKLYAWLYPRLEQINETEERALRRWRNGSTANVYSVDNLLTRNGLHLHELPEDVWTDDNPRVIHGLKPPAPIHVREAAVKDRLAGEGTTAVARRYGIHPRTVRTWVQKQQPKAA